MDINYHLLIDIIIILGAVSFVLIAKKIKNKNHWNDKGKAVRFSLFLLNYFAHDLNFRYIIFQLLNGKYS